MVNNSRNIRAFTLIEMMIVIAIAMVLMGLGASSYQSLKHNQGLSMASYAVQGALQKARSQAMQLNKVVRVFFLDGGQVRDGSGPRNYAMSSTGTVNSSDDADTYLHDMSTYQIPYELMLMTSDGIELAREQLPESYGWISLGQGAGAGIATLANAAGMADPVLVSGSYYPGGVEKIGRNCSLIINFAPTGACWVDAAAVRDVSATVAYANGVDTTTNIRIFNIDDLDSVDKTSSGPPYYIVTDNMWDYHSTDSKIENIVWWKTVAASNNFATSAAESVSMRDTDIKWHTIKMNYNTGLCNITYNKNE